MILSYLCITIFLHRTCSAQHYLGPFNKTTFDGGGGVKMGIENANSGGVGTSAVVDTTFVDIYVDTKNIPTCRYNIQHIDK